jgi:hypothetical protein
MDWWLLLFEAFAPSSSSYTFFPYSWPPRLLTISLFQTKRFYGVVGCDAVKAITILQVKRPT